MSDVDPAHMVRTRIWREDPEADNPFAARAAYCRGYDVFGEMLGQARWVDMLYLLFFEEPPTAKQAELLERLAVALANPGPRDPSVHAAMCAGVCGSTAASSLMAALAVGAGGLSGARDVLHAMQCWQECGTDLAKWTSRLSGKAASTVSIWPEAEHAPGFDPHGRMTATVVRQALERLAACSPGAGLGWLQANLPALESAAGCPLGMSGVAAAAFHDLGASAEQGEMLHLLLRLPGAAAHALEQRGYGFRQFPFFDVQLMDDPAKEQT